MDNFEALHPRVTTGQFDTKVQSAPETDLSVPDSASPAWSPDPTLAHVRQDMTDPGNYTIAVAQGGFVDFDMSRESLDPEAFFDHLIVQRSGAATVAIGVVSSVDFTEILDDPDEAGEWLGQRQTQIGEYLAATYNVTDDDNMEWDDSQLLAKTNIDGLAIGGTDSADDEINGTAAPTDGRETYNTFDIFVSIWDDPKRQGLMRDLRDDVFISKLRDHLNSFPYDGDDNDPKTPGSGGPAVVTSAAPPTYTLDVRLPNGAFGEDHGLTAEQIAQARERAPGLDIEILAVTEETPVSAGALAAFGVHL